MLFKILSTLTLGVCLFGDMAAGASIPLQAAAPSSPQIVVPAGKQPAPASFSHDAPPNFDPAQFGTLTTASLPQENGQPLVMRVNGRTVSWEDFSIQGHMAGAALMAKRPGQELNIMSALQQPVMEALILQEIYREFAEKNHLVIQPAEVDRRMEQMEKSREPAVHMAVGQLTAPQKLRLLTDALIHEKVDKFIGDRATSVPATAEEITSIVATLRPTTSPVELFRARHIVIRATPDMSQFNVNDAKAKADEVLAKIRGGLDFATAAHQYSQDRFTAYQGGNIGYFTTGTLYPAFEAAAATLTPGQISDVVRTPVGFHIIQVTERHRDNLLLLLDTYKRQLAVEQWKNEAGNAATVERYLK